MDQISFLKTNHCDLYVLKENLEKSYLGNYDVDILSQNEGN